MTDRQKSILSLLCLLALTSFFTGCGEEEAVTTNTPSVKPPVAEPEITDPEIELNKRPQVEYFSIHELCKSPNATPNQLKEFIDLKVDVNEVKGDKGRAPLHSAAIFNSNSEVIQMLIDAGADVNQRDLDGLTPLHLSADRNVSPSVTSTLIKSGADIDLARDGLTPLMSSLLNTNSEVTLLLIKAGANLNASAEVGDLQLSPLMLCAMLGNKESGLLLIKAGADIHSTSSGLNALHFAVAEGFTNLMTEADFLLDSLKIDNSHKFEEFALALIDAGIDVSAESNSSDFLPEGLTPLHMCAGFSSSTKLMSAIIEAGADVNQLAGTGESPLHLAIEGKGGLGIISLLVRSGAKVNARTSNGVTPLHLAVSVKSQLEVISFLLDSGARIEDPGPEDVDGGSVLHTACLFNDDPQVVSELLRRKADVNGRTERLQITPLMLASGSNTDGRVIQILIDAGADTDVIGPDGNNLLHIAARTGNINAFTLLLKEGLDINAKDYLGSTPFHCAASATPFLTSDDWGGTELLSFLLTTELDPNDVDSSGAKPIDLARKNRWLRNTEALRKLEEATAE